MVGPVPLRTVTIFEIVLIQPHGALWAGDEEGPASVAVSVTV
jgi:hypothetical protein